MRGMKKLISVCVALATVLASFAFVLPASAWEENPESVDIRFGIVNDTHITNAGNAVDKLQSAVSALKSVGCSDGLALVGDVIYYNSANSDPTDTKPYDYVYNAINAAGYAREEIIAYAMGNHEFPQANIDADVSATSINTFENYTGFDMNHHTVKNGFHFIAGGAINYNGTYSAETQDWLMTEIDKAIAEDATNDVDGAFADGVIPNSPKPVFLLLHHPIDGTIFNVTGDKFTDEFVAFLKNRPQVINVTAHWHISAALPQTIWQDGFTQYQGAMIGGGFLEEYEATSTGNINAYSQGAYIDVLDNVVKIHKMDYTNGCEIGEPWVIDVPAIVADRTDSDSTNDNDNYLYTEAKRAQVTSSAAFPEGAEITAETTGTAVTVTYPNNAVMTSYDEIQQDNFVRGYKVELVNNQTGKASTSALYMTDFYKAEADRAESFTRTIGGLAYGTEYTVNVYPQTPLGAFGAPLSATITTEAEKISDSAIRYEFEDYFPISGVIKSSDLASDGKIVSSHQSGEYITNYTTVPRNEENPVVTVTIPVALPYAGDYNVRYAASYHTNSAFVSYMDFYVDDALIGTNDGSFDMDLSINNTYPWQYTPLKRYKKTVPELTAGVHTVKVDIHLPTTTAQAQPFLFCLDYIEFEPLALIAGPGKTAKAEFEDYIADVSFEQTDGTTYVPRTIQSEGCSGGAYAFFDSTDGIGAEYVDIRIPVNVEEDGVYNMEYVINNGTTHPNIYVDDKANGAVNTSRTTATIDTKSDTLFPYFESSWASALRADTTVTLTKGTHVLIVEIPQRSSTKDIAQYLDYIKLSNDTLTVDPEETTQIDFSDYMDNFSPKATVWEHDSAESGVLAYAGGGAETTFTMPFVAKETGKYSFTHTGAYSPNLSDIYVYIDSTDSEPIYVINAENETYKDLSENGEVYQNKNGWLKKEYSFTSKISAGLHNLIYVIKDRGNGQGVAYAFDNVKITGFTPEIDTTKTMRLELEDYQEKVSIPLSDSTHYTPWISEGECSNGAYLGIDTGDGLAVENYYSFSIPVFVKESAVYKVSYAANKGTSPLAIFLDGTIGEMLLGDSSANVSVLDDTKGEDGKNPYFQSSWAVACLYESNAYIPAGKHEITFRLTKREGANDFARYLDYIEFAIAEADLLPIDGATRFEYEEFGTAGVQTDLPYASGNSLLHQNWSDTPVNIYIPVNVEKSGWYNIEYVVSDTTVTKDGEPNVHDGYLSKIDIYVDDEFVGTNRGGGVENLGSVYEIYNDTAPVCRYESQIYLEKGLHLVKTIVNVTKDSKYKYTLDYIEIAPKLGISETDAEVMVTTQYENAVSGEVVLALYNGNKLVSLGTAVVENSTTVTVSAPKVAYTDAKVMVWDALGGLNPVVAEKIYQK